MFWVKLPDSAGSVYNVHNPIASSLICRRTSGLRIRYRIRYQLLSAVPVDPQQPILISNINFPAGSTSQETSA